jgi:D-arabinose 1-dehydrogenase-like Zn-dependent alcohol dehydrogenase
MLSYDVVEHGKPLQRAVRETPQPKGKEVLVRITRSGVCHSDLHIWDGYFDWGGGKRFYVKDRGCVPPFTLGHEPYGVVEALGPDATGVAVGSKRVVRGSAAASARCARPGRTTTASRRVSSA